MHLLASDNPLEHVLDYYPGGPVTMHMVTLTVAGILTVLFLMLAARAIRTGPESQGNQRYVTKSRFGQVVEVMTLYLRDEMLKPVLGERDTKRYFPYLLTLFFFILFNNLMGLVPVLDILRMVGLKDFKYFGGTATGNINVTIGLAAIAFFVIIIHGFRELGLKGFIDHLTGGLLREHWALWAVVPIILVVELAGLVIKPAALAIRLFANMLAGHVLLAVLLGFGAGVAAGAGKFTFGAGAITIVSGAAAVAVMFLELFVAFLQAFIFMFLTAVFVSLMSHHDEEHHEETGHELEPAHA